MCARWWNNTWPTLDGKLISSGMTGLSGPGAVADIPLRDTCSAEALPALATFTFLSSPIERELAAAKIITAAAATQYLIMTTSN